MTEKTAICIGGPFDGYRVQITGPDLRFPLPTREDSFFHKEWPTEPHSRPTIDTHTYILVDIAGVPCFAQDIYIYQGAE
jgi:hypothetical protein